MISSSSLPGESSTLATKSREEMRLGKSSVFAFVGPELATGVLGHWTRFSLLVSVMLGGGRVSVVLCFVVTLSVLAPFCFRTN